MCATDQSVGRIPFCPLPVNLLFRRSRPPSRRLHFQGFAAQLSGWRPHNRDGFFCGYAAQRFGRRRRKDETDDVPVEERVIHYFDTPSGRQATLPWGADLKLNLD